MLSLGSSKQWPEAMKFITGGRKMEASAILEYFKPLEDWLIKTNKESGAPIGWKKTYRKFIGIKVSLTIYKKFKFFRMWIRKRKCVRNCISISRDEIKRKVYRNLIYQTKSIIFYNSNNIIIKLY